MIKLRENTEMTSLCKTAVITVPKGTEVNYERYELPDNQVVHIVSHQQDGKWFFATRNGNPRPQTIDPKARVVGSNDRTINTSLSNADAASRFVELFGHDDTNWIWYHIHTAIQRHDIRPVSNALDFIVDSFVLAIGYGLKRPMIRVHYLDQRFKIYLSQRGTVCIKSGWLVEGTKDPTRPEQYLGCLLGGRFLENDRRQMTSTEREFLSQLTDSPIDFLAQCSKDMCRCCYCMSPLEDFRSLEVGYGTICAKHCGLPWGSGS